MQMLLNGGVYNGKRILSPHTIRMMTMNQIGEIPFSRGNTFGLGFEVVTAKGSYFSPMAPGTYSWGGMFSSSYWIDPENKVIAQLFLQIFPYSHGDIHEKFKIMVYQLSQTNFKFHYMLKWFLYSSICLLPTGIAQAQKKRWTSKNTIRPPRW